jgi:hypothetical protein
MRPRARAFATATTVLAAGLALPLAAAINQAATANASGCLAPNATATLTGSGRNETANYCAPNVYATPNWGGAPYYSLYLDASGVRVWLKQEPNATGWAYCYNAGTAHGLGIIPLPSPQNQADYLQVTTNTAAC